MKGESNEYNFVRFLLNINLRISRMIPNCLSLLVTDANFFLFIISFKGHKGLITECYFMKSQNILITRWVNSLLKVIFHKTVDHYLSQKKEKDNKVYE